MRLRSVSKASPETRFYLTLARELGMTKGELLTRMSSYELTEWMALYSMEAKEREAARNRG